MLTRRAAALGLGGGLGAMLAGYGSGAAAKSARIGQPAPDFQVTTFDKQHLGLADLHGQVIVLNYWATWCTPCRAEMLVMDAYVRRHRSSDLRIFAVTTESSVPDSKLKPLAAVLAFPLISRLRGSGYGMIGGAVPTSYVIDRSGVIRHAEAGAFTEASFDALITPLLAQPAPTPPPAAV
jgi:cytochrome c biogenesis protein CcmG/thiol:disulfide interchange protein DsbE